jgi:ABC-type Mn2+/Zn2+ transport system ATPase subunit
MDVIAMRKNTGEITGEIRLNGHIQEEISFRRCMGYVEQFDVQSPQLTIKETCEFSARLRLDSSNPAVTPENTTAFVQQTLNMLELTNIQDLQVGTDAAGGLSFEQRKRLSIAVELVANPSILFLDEVSNVTDRQFPSPMLAEFRLELCSTKANIWSRRSRGSHGCERVETSCCLWSSSLCHDSSTLSCCFQ